MNNNRTANYKWNSDHRHEKDKIISKKISTSAQNGADGKHNSDVCDKYRSD
jgi:hypothetical protein